MEVENKELAVQKIVGMSREQVVKVLIFMEGMEAEHVIWEQEEGENFRQPHRHTV